MYKPRIYLDRPIPMFLIYKCGIWLKDLIFPDCVAQDCWFSFVIE
jgi:hypothetical protein